MNFLKNKELTFTWGNFWTTSWFPNHRRFVLFDALKHNKIRYDGTRESWVIGHWFNVTVLNFHLIMQLDEPIEDHDPRIGDNPKAGLL